MPYTRNKIGIVPPIYDPIDALDYPALLPDTTWVIWVGQGRWPEAGRLVRYLSKTATHPMGGFHLLTPQHRDAMRFDTYDDAMKWLADQNEKRGQPWNLNVTTVEQLKLAMGYYVEVN